MQAYRTSVLTVLSVLTSAVVIAACGSSSSTTPSSSSSTPKTGGTVSLVMGTAPQSLDPGLDYTTQGGEENWLAYTGLTSYAHAEASPGRS